MAKCDSLVGRIERLIQAMDLLGVRLERASRGPSLATGPAKRMQAAATNEMHTDIAASSVNKNAILNTVAAESSQTATVTAPEDVIDPSHAAPGRVWYGGPTTEDVQEHRLCIVPPEKSSYIRPTGKRGRYEHVWADGSVTPSAFSDGGLNQCLKSPGWSMAYEPTARVAIGLPALSELDHCREGGAL